MNLGLFLTVFGVFSFLVAIMAIGVMMGRRPISGSCGGIGRVNGEDSECAICGGDPLNFETAIYETSVVGRGPFSVVSRSRLPHQTRAVP